MTTIFWHATSETLYADSRTRVYAEQDDTKRDGSLKILTLGPDDQVPWDFEHQILALAGAGRRSVTGWLAEQALVNGKKIALRLNRYCPPTLSHKGVHGALIVVTTGQVFKVQLSRKRGRSVEMQEANGSIAIGSGASHVMLANQFFGLSPLDSMRFARTVDPSTGGQIHRIVRDQAEGRVDALEPYPAAEQHQEYNDLITTIGKLPRKEPQEYRPYHHGTSKRISRLIQEPRARVRANSE